MEILPKPVELNDNVLKEIDAIIPNMSLDDRKLTYELISQFMAVIDEIGFNTKGIPKLLHKFWVSQESITCSDIITIAMISYIYAIYKMEKQNNQNIVKE